MSPVSYIPGFSDFFASMARVKSPGVDGVFNDTATINTMFARAKNDFNARMLRFKVDWAVVEPDEPGQPGHSYHFDTYNALAGLAWFHGFQILPHVHGAPTWAQPPFDQDHPNKYRGYPREDVLPAFGTFVAETLSYFSQVVPGVCRAVEVCNEPNLNKNWIDPSHYKLMLQAALEAVIARSCPFQPTYMPRVISGGLSCNDIDTKPPHGTPDWEQYLAEILNQCPPVLPSGEFFHPAIGIHPYDTTEYTGTQADAVRDFVHEVKNKCSAAMGIATAGNEIWITEFGCTAKSPFGEAGKHEALRRLLATDGYFTTQSRCKAVLMYRYLPQSVSPDDTVNQPYWEYWDSVPMLGNDLLGKQPVADMLKRTGKTHRLEISNLSRCVTVPLSTWL